MTERHPKGWLVASVKLELTDEDRAEVDRLRVVAGLAPVDWDDPGPSEPGPATRPS